MKIKAQSVEKYEVVEVETDGDGWRLAFRHPDGRKWTFVPKYVCAVTPQAGEEIIFEASTERRGITVGGRLYVSSWPPEGS